MRTSLMFFIRRVLDHQEKSSRLFLVPCSYLSKKLKIVTSHFYLVFSYFMKPIFTFTVTMLLVFLYFVVAK